jgi:curved DNA-binding protein CbpA
MRNLYSVLNLSRRANNEDIKTAYWALAKQFHPDVNAGNHDAERWTKEINRAYEILGDPDARTAYDLELAQQRAKARISFLRSAAIGAATFTLTAGSISMVVVWKEHALKIRSAKNETRAPGQKRAASRSARSEQPESGADPVDSAPHPEPPSELPAPTRSAIVNAALADREALGTSAPSSVVSEQPPNVAEPSAAPSQPSRTDLPEAPPVPQACLGHKDDNVRIQGCSALILHDPRDAVAFHNRGLAYVAKDDIDRAIADYTRAIELNPNYGPAFEARARAYARKGDHIRAIADVTRASELAPKVAAAVVKTTTMKTQPSPKGALSEGAVTQQTPLGTTLIETPPGGPYPPWALRNLGRY